MAFVCRWTTQRDDFDFVSSGRGILFRHTDLNSIVSRNIRDECKQLRSLLTLRVIDFSQFLTGRIKHGHDNIDAALRDRHLEILIGCQSDLIRVRLPARQRALDRDSQFQRTRIGALLSGAAYSRR